MDRAERPLSSAPPGTPDARADRFRVGAKMLMSLLAGRSAYRLVTLATTVLLLPVWGEERYRAYAAALASFGWLLVLVFTGPEKLVLKLLPRAPRTGPQVRDAILAVAWWLPLPLAAGYLLLRTGDGSAALYVGAAGMLVSVGCTQLLVGLHRAAGRPRSDVFTFLSLTVVELGLLAAAVAGWLGPLGFVGAVTVIHVLVNLTLTLTLGRPSLRIRRRPGFLRRLGWSVLFLSGADLFLLLTTAVLFAVLDRSGHAGELGRLYVVVLILSVGVNIVIYLLRVLTPGTSLRLAGRAGPAGQLRAARLAGLVVAGNTGWLVVVGALIATTGLADATGTAQLLVWTGLLLARAPGLAVLLRASFLLENTDASGPRLVGLASVGGLLAAGLAGVLLVPAFGGTGVIAAYTAAEAGYALLLALVAGRRAGDHARGARRAAVASLRA